MPKRSARETLSDWERRRIAEEILIERLTTDASLDECWKAVHPKSTAKPESARVMASRLVHWYIDKYPDGYEKLMKRAYRGLYKRLGD
jgi:hypothetical protein